MKNEHQLTTSGHKTFGVQWLFQRTTTHQLSATVDTNAARSPKRFYTAGRYMTFLTKTVPTKKFPKNGKTKK